jgi:hypothetical protein
MGSADGVSKWERFCHLSYEALSPWNTDFQDYKFEALDDFCLLLTCVLLFIPVLIDSFHETGEIPGNLQLVVGLGKLLLLLQVITPIRPAFPLL